MLLDTDGALLNYMYEHCESVNKPTVLRNDSYRQLGYMSETFAMTPYTFGMLFLFFFICI